MLDASDARVPQPEDVESIASSDDEELELGCEAFARDPDAAANGTNVGAIVDDSLGEPEPEPATTTHPVPVPEPAAAPEHTPMTATESASLSIPTTPVATGFESDDELEGFTRSFNPMGESQIFRKAANAPKRALKAIPVGFGKPSKSQLKRLRKTEQKRLEAEQAAKSADVARIEEAGRAAETAQIAEAVEATRVAAAAETSKVNEASAAARIAAEAAELVAEAAAAAETPNIIATIVAIQPADEAEINQVDGIEVTATPKVNNQEPSIEAIQPANEAEINQVDGIEVAATPKVNKQEPSIVLLVRADEADENQTDDGEDRAAHDQSCETVVKTAPRDCSTFNVGKAFVDPVAPNGTAGSECPKSWISDFAFEFRFFAVLAFAMAFSTDWQVRPPDRTTSCTTSCTHHDVRCRTSTRL